MVQAVALLTDFSKREKEEAFSQLSLPQQAYIKSKPSNKAEQSIVTRILLARLVKEESGKDVLSLIEFDENKRPHILGEPDLHISISHSDRLVAAAFSSKPIGIDIEKIKPISSRLAEKALNPLELDFIKTDRQAFFKIWTAREALIKTGAFSYAEAKKFCFIKDDKITAPEGFNLEQYQFKDFSVSVIEHE